MHCISYSLIFFKKRYIIIPIHTLTSIPLNYISYTSARSKLAYQKSSTFKVLNRKHIITTSASKAEYLVFNFFVIPFFFNQHTEPENNCWQKLLIKRWEDALLKSSSFFSKEKDKHLLKTVELFSSNRHLLLLKMNLKIYHVLCNTSW